MDSGIREVLDLIARWMHVIAGIMWVGNSMLFNWLDRNLVKVEGRRKEHVGRIWMLHSGAFYDVEKTMLPPGEMPDVLHWFKWQSYTTWLTGTALLFIVYYMGDGSLLVAAGGAISVDKAKDIGIAVLVLGFLSYELTWRLIGKKYENAAQLLSIGFLIAAVYLCTHLFIGRAAFIHVGALMGTCMAGNVFFHIIPSQHELVRTTKEGRPQEMSLSHRAKQRSIHNNYLTFPLLFIMVSNHYPSTFSQKQSWLVLLVIIAFGASVRHILNIRFEFEGWVFALGSVITVGVVAIGVLTGVKFTSGSGSGAVVEKVAFSRVNMVIHERCVPCHAESPADTTYSQAPKGVLLETPEQIKSQAQQIKIQAVVTKAMPQGNKTGITEPERALLAQWIMGGAEIQ
jgi:uncharacterized membrane protein